jgi:hypothetical protein
MTKDYSKGKIYSLRTNKSNKIYIGSTIMTLPNRLSYHKGHYKKYLSNKHHYVYSFYLFENYDDIYIELIELYPCSCKAELERREGEIQRDYKSKGQNVINKNIAGRTKKEYYQDNIEMCKQLNKQNYIKNIERVKEKHQVWRDNNKDKVREISKKHYELNKDKLNKRRSEIITCECGRDIARGYISKHIKTKVHLEFLGKVKDI